MNLQEMRECKRALGYSNETLAELSGVPLATVQKVLSGITKSPRQKTVEALSKVLGAGKPAGSPAISNYSVQLRRGEDPQDLKNKTDIAEEAALKWIPESASGKTARQRIPESASGNSAHPDHVETVAEQPAVSRTGYVYPEVFTGIRSVVREDDRPNTIEDIYALPDGTRAELIDGKLYYIPTPTRTHQKITGEMYLAAAAYIKAYHRECEVYIAPFGV